MNKKPYEKPFWRSNSLETCLMSLSMSDFFCNSTRMRGSSTQTGRAFVRRIFTGSCNQVMPISALVVLQGCRDTFFNYLLLSVRAKQLAALLPLLLRLFALLMLWSACGPVLARIDIQAVACRHVKTPAVWLGKASAEKGKRAENCSLMQELEDVDVKFRYARQAVEEQLRNLSLQNGRLPRLSHRSDSASFYKQCQAVS